MKQSRNTTETANTPWPGRDLGAAESADALQHPEDAETADENQRDDLQDEDIITLDGSD